MRTVIVFNHPYKGSYCNAILKAVVRGLKRAGSEIDLIHLDKEVFNPAMTGEDLKAFRDKKPVDPKAIEYAGRIRKADWLVFIFPVWWEVMPALTKGFMDKVVFPGVFYENTKSGLFMRPLLPKLKGVRIITTMNTPKPLYALWFGNPIKKSMLAGTFRMMGYKNSKWMGFSMVKFVSQNKRRQWLVKLEKDFARLK